MAQNTESIVVSKIVVKVLFSDILFESRDKKEISVLQEIGCEVKVLCSGEKTEKIRTESGLSVQRVAKLQRNQDQSRLVRSIQIIKRLLLFKRFLKSYHADCISCHDIYALLIGWISTWFIPEIRKPLLVYDSHEFEIGRNTKEKRGIITKWLIACMEKLLMKRCAFSIMVNDSIADAVQKIHKLKDRPIVVRNIPPYWNIDEKECQKKHMEFCNALNVHRNTFIAMYHGMIAKGRGAENFIKAIKMVENTIGMILGYGEEEYVQSLKDLAISHNISGRILFHPAVQHSELWQYIGAVDVGMVTINNTCMSYYYSLPNKLFENIQSETPIIGSNFPEINRVIKKYNIGLCCDPDDANDIANAIDKMRNDKELYALFKQNLKKAKSELNWENERDILKKAYTNILSNEELYV